MRKRESIRVENIEEPIQAPENIDLEEERESNDKRVALPEEQLKRKIISLFVHDRDAWKVEEVANSLQQPRQPVKNVME